jgi:hypothetical protein
MSELKCTECGHTTPHTTQAVMLDSGKKLEPMWCEENGCTCCHYSPTPTNKAIGGQIEWNRI